MPDPVKPTTEGTFAKTPFANVLLYAREKKMNGSIVVTIEPNDPVMREQLDVAGQSTLVLEEGRIVAVALPRTVDTLAWVLRDLNLINDAMFEQVQAALQKPGADEISTIMRLRACSPITLDRALREQTRRKVAALFGFSEGSYAYYARADLLNGAERVRTPEDVLPVVWRAFTHSPPEAALVDPVLDRIGNRAIKLKEGSEFDRFEFGDEVGLAATQLRVSPSGIDQLVGLGSDPAIVRAMVYLLALTRQIEVVAVPTAPPPTASMPPPVPARAPARQPPPPPPRTAPPPAPQAVQGPPKEEVEEEIEAAEEPTDAPTQAAVTAAEALEAAKIEAAERHLRDLDHQTYFEMFGLTYTASMEEIRSAFPKVAAPWHPDRVTNARLKELYTEIFSHYNVAHATLTEPRAREQYEGSLSGGGGTPAAQKQVAAVLDTVQDAHRAEVAFKRKDYAEAEKLLRKVMVASPDDLHVQLLLAQVLFEMDPAGKTDEAIALTAKVLKNTEKSDKPLALMGALLKQREDRRYISFYREALQVNPNHVEANREVRLYEVRELKRREQNTATGKITGFFNKLLKR